MAINESDIERIASLAKLRLKPGEKERLLVDLNNILDYMEIINEIDSKDVSEKSSPRNSVNSLRDDKIETGVKHQTAIKNAPESKDGLIGVPKIIKPL